MLHATCSIFYFRVSNGRLLSHMSRPYAHTDLLTCLRCWQMCVHGRDSLIRNPPPPPHHPTRKRSSWKQSLSELNINMSHRIFFPANKSKVTSHLGATMGWHALTQVRRDCLMDAMDLNVKVPSSAMKSARSLSARAFTGQSGCDMLKHVGTCWYRSERNVCAMIPWWQVLSFYVQSERNKYAIRQYRTLVRFIAGANVGKKLLEIWQTFFKCKEM